MTTMRRPAISLLQAAQEAPTLARLAQLARESSERLAAVQFLIPKPLRPAIQPGPIDGSFGSMTEMAVWAYETLVLDKAFWEEHWRPDGGSSSMATSPPHPYLERELAGLRPGTPDNVPLVGPGAEDGLLLATGHHRNGILHAPLAAELVARELTGALASA